MTFYVTQMLKEFDVFATALSPPRWVYVTNRTQDLSEARESYKEIWMAYPKVDVRLVRGFFLDGTLELRVLEVIEYKKGKP